MRYFRKLNPKNVIQLSIGSHIKFDTLDNVTGYYATEDSGILSEFERARREQRGGIIEITAEEFEREYAQKKRSSPNFQPKPRSREEITPGMITSDTALKPVLESHTSAPVALAQVAALNGSDIRKKDVVVPPPPAPVEVATAPAEPAAPKARTARVSAVKRGAAAQAELEGKSTQEPLAK